MPYAMVSSQVAALIEWVETLDRGSIAVHVQLPPVLTPLREILDQMLQGQPGDATTWARLVAVAEAFEALISGDTLTHPADVLGQSQGGTASPLLCADGVLVRGIAMATPEQHQGGPGEWTPDQWWYAERHHGLGDAARSAAGDGAASTSPRSRPHRRPRSPSSDASHRRRRVLAEHVHGHDL